MQKTQTYAAQGQKLEALRRRWAAGDITSAEFNRRADAILAVPVVEACGSGWTDDRCSKPLGHSGRHSNEGR